MEMTDRAPYPDLPFKIRWKLWRQDALAALGVNNHRRVRIKAHPLGAEIIVDDGRIIVPSPYRWKLYRKGWAARLDQLAAEYGVGRHVTLNADSVVIDIGANAGEFAHICARYGARVWCLEPDATVRACLVENIAALPNATAHDALLWKEETQIAFASIPAHADSSVFAENTATTTRAATTLDTFCAEHEIENIDLIKCDAEGAEPEVLEGAGIMLARTRAVAIDTGAERRGARTHETCRAILEAAGFRVIDEAVGKRLMTYGLRA